MRGSDFREYKASGGRLRPLKTDDAVLVELADPTPLSKSPCTDSASSCGGGGGAVSGGGGGALRRPSKGSSEVPVRSGAPETTVPAPAGVGDSQAGDGARCFLSWAAFDFRCWMTAWAVGKIPSNDDRDICPRGATSRTQSFWDSPY